MVKFSKLADDDVEDIGRYCVSNGINAKKVIDSLFAIIEKLEIFPQMGKPSSLSQEVRRIIKGEYCILYEINGNDVYILSIYSTRRSLDEIERILTALNSR